MSQGSPAHQVHACAAALDLEDARELQRGGATRPAAARLREAQNVEPGPVPDRPICAIAALPRSARPTTPSSATTW